MTDRVEGAGSKQLSTPAWLLVFGVALVGVAAAVFSVLVGLGKIDREPNAEDCARDALPGDSFTTLDARLIIVVLAMVAGIIVLFGLANRARLAAVVAVSVGILALSAVTVITLEPRPSGDYWCLISDLK